MAEQLKNVYTKEYIKNLSIKIKEYYHNFDSDSFISSIFNPTWKTLELKMRMRHIAIALNEYLPLSYKKQLEILKPTSKDFNGFESMFFKTLWKFMD